jgi:hypothetical protein
MLSIMGTLILAKGYSDENVRAFAELYILGNVVAVSATVSPLDVWLGLGLGHSSTRIYCRRA